MALAQEDISYIKEHLPEWLSKQIVSPVAYDLELRERVVRVEDELRHQRELMREGFERMDKRFEMIDKRFEAIDKRFEMIDKRFERMHQRLDRFMVWSFATTLTVGGIVIAALKYLP